MRLRNALLILLLLLALGAAAVLLLIQPETPAQPPPQNGSASALELGRAGDYGYAVFSYNGSGSVTLLALSEAPRKSIIVLKKDYLDTERYSYFMDLLSPLSSGGFSVKEVEEITQPENSIIVIPSGAMPLDVLERLDNLTLSNRVIFIGRKDLLYSGNLVQEDWYSGVSNSTKSRLMIIEKTLDEFYSEGNYSLVGDIERNSWAVRQSASAGYEGEGRKTVFVPLNGSKWLRALPLSDSGALQPGSARVTGPDEIFPWEKARLTVSMNYSEGIAYYRVEKDGLRVASGELGRVRGDQAFPLVLGFNSSGDYLVRIADDFGTIGAKRVHVKSLNVSLAHAYGNAYEFEVLLDSEPVDGERATVGLNHSNNTVEIPVSAGKMLVHANLRQGENIFVISLFGQKTYVTYNNSQESLVVFYAKYLTPGIALVLLFYLGMRVSRKPLYRIRVPEGVPGKNVEVRLRPSHVISAIEGVEADFGWKNVPLYAKEIAFGLKRFVGGMELNEGNVEAVMKKLEQKGLVRSHLGLYGLAGWGDEKRNALKRIIRDKLVENGVVFSETAHGFDCGEKAITLDPEKAPRESIAVFEDREDMRAYLSSLVEKKRARLEIRLRNGTLRLATLDELDELI